MLFINRGEIRIVIFLCSKENTQIFASEPFEYIHKILPNSIFIELPFDPYFGFVFQSIFLTFQRQNVFHKSLQFDTKLPMTTLIQSNAQNYN